MLNGIAISLVVILIAVVVGALVIAEVKSQAVDLGGVNSSDSTTWTNAYNTSLEAQTQLGSLKDWLGIIVVASVGAAILGLVMLFKGR